MMIDTPRLVLRAAVLEDAIPLEAVFCDPDVMRFSDDGAYTPVMTREWVEKMVAKNGVRPFTRYVVVEKESGAVIGYCGLSQRSTHCRDDEAELGYRLAHAFWGKGYATEAAAAVSDYALANLPVRQLVAMVDPGNVASVRVLQKSGYRFDREIMFEHYDHPDHVYVRTEPRLNEHSTDRHHDDAS